jgi:iron complex outermembrane receptor protein
LAVAEGLDLTLGSKLERDPYSGWSPLPDVRLTGLLSESDTVWAAASRAIRSPTPFDTDVQEKLNGSVFLIGNPAFKPETVNAYELGYRGNFGSSLSLSTSLFYNVYADLRSIEFAGRAGLPLTWGNMMLGHTYGAQAWASWTVTGWWRLAPAVQFLRKALEFGPGSTGILGVAQAGDDPHAQARLQSSMNLDSRTTFDASLRHVGTLPDPHQPAYVELQASLNRHLWRGLDLSLTGLNLLHECHLEYPTPDGECIRRSVLLESRWTF